MDSDSKTDSERGDSNGSANRDSVGGNEANEKPLRKRKSQLPIFSRLEIREEK